MRSILKYSVLLLGAAVYSCGSDDDSAQNAAPVAGSSNSGTSGASAGSGNKGGSSQQGGSAGSAAARGGTGGSTGGGTNAGRTGTGGASAAPGDAGTSNEGGQAGSKDEPGEDGGKPPMLPTDSSGFTQLDPSSDTVKIYVSSSDGNDGSDGLSPETAVATATRGYALLRDGYPDWLLFKRGDVWTTPLGGWGLSGRSPTERMVISAYGDGERPRFDYKGDSALRTDGGFSEKTSMDNLVFSSIEFNSVNHDLSLGPPQGDGPACISWLRGMKDVLFEDMKFSYCQVGIQAKDGYPIERLRFFRNVFTDNYSITGEHAQALFLYLVGETSVEENVFDHCGWHPDVDAADPTIFNHCIYWQHEGPFGGLVRGNMIMRGSSHGVQLRSSGRIENNVLIGNGIGGFLAGGWTGSAPDEQGTIIGNLVTEGADIIPREGHPEGSPGAETTHRAWGFELIDDTQGLKNLVMTGNILTHCRSVDTCRSLPSSWPDSKVENNIVWDWTNNIPEFQPPSTGPFPDPDRTIASYYKSLGGEEDLDAFIAQVRLQSKTNWRPAYTADAVLAYFRKGFGTD